MQNYDAQYLLSILVRGDRTSTRYVCHKLTNTTTNGGPHLELGRARLKT